MPDSSRQIGEQRARTQRLNLHVPEGATEDDGAYYDGIGAELKAERLRWGLKLSEVSSRLRIRQAHLEAIEAGRFGDLPGRIYAIGFVRSYAEFLGADGDVSVSLFKAEFGPGGHSRKLVFPVPPDENRRPGLKTLAASLVLAALVYGGWYVWQSEERTAVELVPEVPERMLEQAARSEVAEPAASSGIGVAHAAETGVSEQSEAVGRSEPELRSIDLAVVGREQETTEAAPLEPLVQADEQATVETTPPSLAADETAAPVESVTPSPTVIAAEHAAAPAGLAATASAGGSATTTDAAASEPARPETPVVADAVPSVPPAAAPAETDAASSETLTQEPVSEDVRIAAVMPPPVPEIEPGSDAAPRVLGIANQDARVLVRATGPVQVIVKRLDGSTVMPHRVLRPGDIYRAPNTENVVLEADRIGNLQIILDGRLIGRGDSLTEPGVGLSLNPAMLKALAN